MVQQGRIRLEQEREDGKEGGDAGTNRQKLVSAGPRGIVPKTE